MGAAGGAMRGLVPGKEAEGEGEGEEVRDEEGSEGREGGHGVAVGEEDCGWVVGAFVAMRLGWRLPGVGADGVVEFRDLDVLYLRSGNCRCALEESELGRGGCDSWWTHESLQSLEGRFFNVSSRQFADLLAQGRAVRVSCVWDRHDCGMAYIGTAGRQILTVWCITVIDMKKGVFESAVQ